MTDEYERAGIENVLIEISSPKPHELAALEAAQEKLKNVRMIDPEAERICGDIYRRYPKWCELVNKQRMERAR